MYNLQNIKVVAAKKNISIKQLITRIKSTEAGFYKSLENNSMNIKTIAQIADVLEVTISELINDRIEYKSEEGLKKNIVLSAPVEIYEPETEIPKLYKIMYEQQVLITDLTRECEGLKNVIAQGGSANVG